MLKKIFAISIIAVALGTSVFAAEDASPVSFNIGISFPQVFNLKPYGTTYTGDDIDSERYSSFGINLGVRSQLSGLPIGIFADVNIYWPLEYKQETSQYIDTYDLSSGKHSFWGVDGILGVYTPVVSTGFLTIPIGAGLHLNYLNRQIDVNLPNKDEGMLFSLGLGLYTNLEFAVTNSVTLYGGVRFAWDFFAYSKNTHNNLDSQTTVNGYTVTRKPKTSESNSGGTSMLYLTPALGIIFRF